MYLHLCLIPLLARFLYIIGFEEDGSISINGWNRLSLTQYKFFSLNQSPSFNSDCLIRVEGLLCFLICSIVVGKALLFNLSCLANVFSLILLL